MRLEPAPLTHPDVQRLVAAVQAHYRRIYGGPDASPISPDEFAPPRGHFVLGTVPGPPSPPGPVSPPGTAPRPVAMGGWRLRPDLDDLFHVRVAELKRMYVDPAMRRRGLARQLLAHLEDSARAAGAGQVVLETGTMQPEAIALYESSGYQPTLSFGHYAAAGGSRYYAKTLDGSSGPASSGG